LGIEAMSILGVITSETLISESAIRAMYKHWRREMGV
jgi:hypothetical protein